MAGEGAMMAMISSLKNNKSLLSKRKEKNGLLGSYSKIELEFNTPKLSVEELFQLQLKIRKEQKLHSLKVYVVFGVLFTVLFFGIITFLS